VSDALYIYANFSLILRINDSLRVFANKMLRRTFGTRKKDVTGDWRRLYNGELRVIESRRMWQVRYMAKDKYIQDLYGKSKRIPFHL
jgi:hypothetical protein